MAPSRIAGVPPDPDHVRAAAELIVRDGGTRLLPRTIRYIEDRRRQEDRFTGAIETHPSPLTIVWGDLDPIAVWAMTDQLLERRPDAARIRLEGVGHYPMVEAPAAFAAAVLAGLDAPEPCVPRQPVDAVGDRVGVGHRLRSAWIGGHGRSACSVVRALVSPLGRAMSDRPRLGSATPSATWPEPALDLRAAMTAGFVVFGVDRHDAPIAAAACVARSAAGSACARAPPISWRSPRGRGCRWPRWPAPRRRCRGRRRPRHLVPGSTACSSPARGCRRPRRRSRGRRARRAARSPTARSASRRSPPPVIGRSDRPVQRRPVDVVGCGPTSNGPTRSSTGATASTASPLTTRCRSRARRRVPPVRWSRSPMPTRSTSPLGPVGSSDRGGSRPELGEPACGSDRLTRWTSPAGSPRPPHAPDLVAAAEQLGYRRAWMYDSPALYPDVWVALSRAADRTSTIGLGPGVLVPSLRHVMVTAAATVGLADLAPGPGRARHRHRLHRPPRARPARPAVGRGRRPTSTRCAELLAGEAVAWDGARSS